MVNPGGTGIPMFDISARFAPLPPRRFFISLLPSALPPPKWKMRLPAFTATGASLALTFLATLLPESFAPFSFALTFALTPLVCLPLVSLTRACLILSLIPFAPLTFIGALV
jgi:hypothetical protein